jgi:hypothetical protein
MSEAPFGTLDELMREFPRLKRGHDLHPLIERRLGALLEDIWPGAHAKPEPGEMPAGRADLGFYFADGRYAVFEIFVSVSQVPQDLRHLEQSNAEARIAILTDPLLDNGAIYREYYGKKPRDPFPAINVSDILVAENEAAVKEKLKEYIDEAFSTTEQAPQSAEALASRLAELGLDNPKREDFGTNRFTADVARVDSRHVIIAAMPIGMLQCAPTTVLKTAARMLDGNNWRVSTGDALPPRYWPQKIFRPPRTRHAGGDALLWEDAVHGGTSVRSRLVLTDRAEVLFVSSSGARFVTKLSDGRGVFVLGRIVADC